MRNAVKLEILISILREIYHKNGTLRLQKNHYCSFNVFPSIKLLHISRNNSDILNKPGWDSPQSKLRVSPIFYRLATFNAALPKFVRESKSSATAFAVSNFNGPFPKFTFERSWTPIRDDVEGTIVKRSERRCRDRRSTKWKSQGTGWLLVSVDRSGNRGSGLGL